MQRACKGHASARNFELLKMPRSRQTSSTAQESLSAWHRKPSSVSRGAFWKCTQPRKGLQPRRSRPCNDARGSICTMVISLLGDPPFKRRWHLGFYLLSLKKKVLKAKGARTLDFTIDGGPHRKGPWLGLEGGAVASFS